MFKTCSNPLCKQNNPQPIENFRQTKRGCRGQCKACEKQKAAEYRAAHREELAEKQRKYYQEHPDIQKQASHRWKQAHVDHISAYNAKYHVNHIDERKAYNKQYAKDHHAGTLERSRKKRAKRYGMNEHFTEEEFLNRYMEYGQECFYCGKKVPFEEITRDHMTPISRGGDDSIHNIVPCCRECNDRKHLTSPSVFYWKTRHGNRERSQTNGIEVV